MQLQNFECQIAKAQIGRYLAGDSLSDEALEQLEAHIGKCAECKQNLAERRAVLQAMLSPTDSEQSEDEPNRRRISFDLGNFIRSKALEKQQVRAAVHAETKPAAFTKPALYSLGLGAVLIGMSYLSKNMGSVLGPKAGQSMAAIESTPISQAPVKNDSVTKATPPPAPQPSNPKPPAIKQVPPKTATPKPAAVKPAPAKISTTPHTHKAPRRSSSDRIHVYSPEK